MEVSTKKHGQRPAEVTILRKAMYFGYENKDPYTSVTAKANYVQFLPTRASTIGNRKRSRDFLKSLRFVSKRRGIQDKAL